MVDIMGGDRQWKNSASFLNSQLFFVSANSCSQDNFYIVVDAYDDANLTMSKNGLPTVR